MGRGFRSTDEEGVGGEEGILSAVAIPTKEKSMASVLEAILDEPFFSLQDVTKSLFKFNFSTKSPRYYKDLASSFDFLCVNCQKSTDFSFPRPAWEEGQALEYIVHVQSSVSKFSIGGLCTFNALGT